MELEVKIKLFQEYDIVTLCIGSAPSVFSATRACPASWNAVIFIVSGDSTALREI
jgi:hypothetical protein